jgi:adenosyl cobinamide kinase/adenosyl cobinamide phosphate guanylyltransferase
MLTVLIGGARSGKSDLAVRLARRERSVVVIATAEAGDEGTWTVWGTFRDGRQ